MASQPFAAFHVGNRRGEEGDDDNEKKQVHHSAASRFEVIRPTSALSMPL
jgi:hypothetical protein